MLLLKADLGAPVGSHGVEERYDCPLCLGRLGRADRKGHLYLNTETRFWICHRCGARGRMGERESFSPLPRGFDLFMARIREAFSPRRGVEEVASVSSVSLPEGTSPLTPGTPAYDYLVHSRGFDPQILAEARVRDWPTQQRVVFPFLQGQSLVYWVARTYVGREPKYVNPPASRRVVLYNRDGADRQAEVVIVEGVTSALRVGRNAVATLGKLVSTEQVREISRLTTQRYVCLLDGDARPENFDLARRLASRVGAPRVRVGLLHPDEDPDSVSRERLQQVLAEAPPWSHFLPITVSLGG